MKREAFFAGLLTHRWKVLTGVTGVVLLAAYGARNVTIDYGVEQFFLERGPERRVYDAYKSLFPREDTRVSLFWKDLRGASAGLYRDMERVAGWFESVGLEDVRWMGSVIVASQRVLDGEMAIEVGPLVPPERSTDIEIARSLQAHASDRLLSGVLWDSSQTVLLIHGYLRQGENTDTTRRAIDSALRDSLATLHISGAELVLTGLPIARAQAPKLLESDLRLLLGAAFAVFALILFWYFRRPSHVILSLLSVVPAYVVVLGVMGYGGKAISILTSFIPIVVLVVGMSDAVHILSEYRQRRTRTSSRNAAIASTFAVMAGPCFYTSATTAVGFASLAGTRIGIVVDFGILTALAILLAFVFTMTAFPVLLSFSRDRAGDDQVAVTRWMSWIIEAAAERAAAPSRAIVGLAAFVAAVAVTFAAHLRTDTYLIDDTKQTAPFMQDIQWIDRHGFGFFQVNALIEQKGDRPLHSPEALSWMEDFRRFAESHPLVTHVSAPTDFFAHLRRATLGPDAGAQPQSLEEASQLLLMAQLQDPSFVEDLYREADGVAQVVLVVRDRGSQVLAPFLDRINTYVAEHPFPAGTVRLTGTVTMIHSFTERLLQSFGPSIIIAIVLITGIMMWMFQSVRLGFIALLPNLFPLIVVLGSTAALGYGLKPSTVLVLSIAFGIAVDDTIHLMSRVARHAARRDRIALGLPEGLREAGAVMIVTTLIVAAGFLLLLPSHFEVLSLIGLMTAACAVTALIADLFVLPSIIGLAESRTPIERRSPSPIEGEIP